MKYLLWIVAMASTLTFVSVCVDAQDWDQNVAARVAGKPANRLPASVEETAPEPSDSPASLPDELRGASIEVGFSQDNEPEPHLFAYAADNDKIQLYQLKEAPAEADARVARAPSVPPAEAASKTLSVAVFLKRINQVVEADGFFDAAQARRKTNCKDRYVLRIKAGGKFRERRGCTNQTNDPFAAFAQVFFRDAFVAWSK